MKQMTTHVETPLIALFNAELSLTGADRDPEGEGGGGGGGGRDYTLHLKLHCHH